MKTGRPKLRAFFREKFAELVAAGSPVGEAAKAVRIHRATAYRWCDQMGLHKRLLRQDGEEVTTDFIGAGAHGYRGSRLISPGSLKSIPRKRCRFAT